MRRVPVWQAWALFSGVLAACAGPPDPRDMAAAQTALFGEAMAYRRCMKSNHYLPEPCQPERQAYEAEIAAFRAEYGAPK
jgi:hypothetical protein